MYREFFGLTSLPFNNTPDPRFFFNTPDHEEALASLLYAVEARKGFVLVSGEVGAGKTLLSRLLLNRLPSNVRTAVITNTNLSGPELLAAICREFGLEIGDCGSAADVTVVLEQFLLEQYARDRLAVVIIDEAQNLPTDSLEQLRMLGNLEADDAKLLQVLILGQPELQESFRQPAMQQTFQRIFRTYHLQGLNEEMTAAYIAHRLKVAGLPEDRTVFDRPAIEAIYEYAQGIPRLINQICDNAMLAAYGESRSEISAPLIREVVEQMMTLTAQPTRTPAAEAPDTEATVGADESAAPELQDTDAAVPPEPVRPEDVSEEHVRALTERLAVMETSLGNDSWDESSPESLRSLQSEAVRMVRNLILNTQDTDRRMRELLNRTQWTALATEERAAAESKLGDQQRELLAERTQDLIRETQSLFKDQQSRFTQEADRRMRELLDKARQSARAVEENSQADLEAGRKQNAKMQAQIHDLMEEVRELTRNHRSELADVIAQQQAELETVKKLRSETIELNEKTVDFQVECERRIRKAAENAEEFCERLQAQAGSTMSEARVATQEFQDQVREMLADVGTRSEASQARSAELLAQQRADSEAARRNIDEFTAALSLRATEAGRENKAILDNLRTEASGILESIRDIHDRTQVKAQQVNFQVEEFVGEMQRKVEKSHQKIEEIVAGAQLEVKTACASLQTTNNQIMAEDEKRRKESRESLEQTKSLLDETRDQCAELLSDLRRQITEQTEESRSMWQAGEQEGTETLRKLNASLADARKETEKTRAEFESLMQTANRELAETRTTLESGIKTHKDDVARLAEDVNNIKAELLEKFETAKSAVEETLEQHRRSVDERVTGIARRSDERIAQAESAATSRVERLKAELDDVAQKAEKVCTELEESIQIARGNADDCQAQFRKESDTIQKDLTELVEQNRGALEDARTTVKSLTEEAGKATETTRADIQRLEEDARERLKRIGTDVETMLCDATSRSSTIRDESESITADLAERMKRTREEAAEAVAKAEESTGVIRRQSERSLDEVRSCLSQMNERSESLRRDLLHMGDEVREAAATMARQVQDVGKRVAAEVEALREVAQQEADANHERLSALQQQVETSAENIQQNAAKLLDQVQAGTSSLRQHAEQLLAQSQSGAEKLNESAAGMLKQAQTAAEQFRERAEQLLHQAETTAEQVGHDIREFRSQFETESKQAKHQADAIKREMAEARAEAARLKNDTTEASEEAQEKADQLLKRAEAVQKQSEELLAMPKKLVDEAKQQAGALAQMSTKISTVIHQLSDAEKKAREHKENLEGANIAADEKLTLLKQHTKRVGQLVGIIRQLYGAMDARIARLRGRLIKADDLVRSVPKEIESLRSVLESSDRLDATHGGTPSTMATGTVQQPTVQDPNRLPTIGTTPAKTVVRAGSANAAAVTGDPANTLGQIVQRNQKLNDWLRDMVGEEAVAENVLKASEKNNDQQAVRSKT